MGKQEEYDCGVRDGRQAGAMDQVCHELGKVFNASELDRAYDAGFDHGVDSKSDSGGSSGSSSGCSSGGSGGCYVTTACLDALNLPRDSLEMKAMKTLTKEHILKSFTGKRDYVSYQRKGPAIVQAIESQKDSRRIWQEVYAKIKDVTSSVMSGNLSEGHALYKELILGLEKQFAG